MKTKQIAALTMAFALAMPFTSFAAKETDGLVPISSIQLTFKADKPVSGESVDDPVDVIPDSDGYVIVDAYYTKDDDEWERNDVPTIKVEIEAEDGYYFNNLKLNKVNGLTRVQSKSIKKDGDKYHAIATIKLKKVAGKLDTPEDLDWNGSMAEWEDIDGVSYYSVRLRRDDKKLTTISTNDTRFDFYPWMTKTGDYTFEVRAMASKTSDNSEWSDESDYLEIRSGEVYTGSAPTTTDYRNNSVSSNGSVGNNTYTPYGNYSYGPGVNSNAPYQNPTSGTANSTQSYSSSWQHDSNGWKFYQNGQWVNYEAWVRDGANWYYIAADGYMKTGWQKVQDKWFYLSPEVNGPLGARKTGWQKINDTWYYLEANGEMQTGYKTIGGREFYLMESGALLMNGTAPNGKVAGADGVLR